jgi:hypothetical protein
MRKNQQPDSRKLISGIGSEREFRWLRLIVMLIIILNVLDATFTLYWINTDLAKEANI